MLGGHFCDVMLGLITEPLRFPVINRFLGFFGNQKQDQMLKIQMLAL